MRAVRACARARAHAKKFKFLKTRQILPPSGPLQEKGWDVKHRSVFTKKHCIATYKRALCRVRSPVSFLLVRACVAFRRVHALSYLSGRKKPRVFLLYSFRPPSSRSNLAYVTMEALTSLLSYFGFGRDNISEGRRRFVVLMAFLSFVLLIAATVAPNWVAGGPSAVRFFATSSFLN